MSRTLNNRNALGLSRLSSGHGFDQWRDLTEHLCDAIATGPDRAEPVR